MPKVGYRFHPTDFELIYYNLTNLILGNTTPIEATISEINVYGYDPDSLPSLSRNQSDNGIYYFFAPKHYTNSNKRFRKRSSDSGIWKHTGDVTDIKDKSGEKIGDKKVLVYQKRGAPKAKGMKSSWVIHEYQITHSQSYPNLNLDTYVICKLFDKRDEAHSSYGNNSSELEPTQYLVSDSNTVGEISTFSELHLLHIQVEQPGQEMDDLFIPMNITNQDDLSMWDCFDPNTLSIMFNDNNNNTNVQLQTPYLSQVHDEFNQGQVERLFSDQDPTMQLEQPYHENSYGMFVNDLTMPTTAQEDHSLCYGFDPNMPPYVSQGDAESISAMSYQGT